MLRSPMLSNRDCAKRQAGMGMWRQLRSATAGYGTGERDEESTRGQKAIASLPAQERPRERDGYELR